MQESAFSPESPLRVAVIGSGPAGCFAVAALLKQKDLPFQVDIFEKRSVAYGLVRFGVAPDHPKIKSVTRNFSKSFAEPNVRFFGNVEIGKDLSLEELLGAYHRVVFSVGAPSDFELGIPGESAEGVHAAREFVGWFNCDPDDADLITELHHKQVAVVGIGNVAMDVARILARPVDELASTDIADHALEVLRTSKVSDIHLIARRGPMQVACTYPELKEICSLSGVDVLVNPADIDAAKQSAPESLDKETEKCFRLLEEVAERPQGQARKRIHFHFFTSPIACIEEDSKLVGLRCIKNELVQDNERLRAVPIEGTEFELESDLMLRAIRYKGIAFPGLPFDERNGVIPNTEGRVEGHPRVYVSGWIKRGASGVIGTNKPDANETIASLVEDAKGSPAPDLTQSVDSILEGLEPRVVSSEDWDRIDKEELRRGAESNRDRVRFVFPKDIFAFLDKSLG